MFQCCSNKKGEEEKRVEKNVTVPLGSFPWLLYQRLVRDSNENLVFSPASIQLAFGMLHLAAVGDTAEALQRLFYGNETDREEIKRQAKAFNELNYFQSSTNATLMCKPANRLYIDTRYAGKLKHDFKQEIAQVFKGDVQVIEFEKGKEARGEINAWVERQTEGQIKDLIPEHV